MKTFKKFAVLGLVASAVITSPALALETLTYSILKEGDPIGQETVKIDQQGDRTVVDVETQTDVKVLFMEFHYKHERQEIWEGDSLISVKTKTNDDGSPHTYTLEKVADGFSLKVDGKESSAQADAMPLSLWTKAVLNRPVLLSVIDAQPYKVTTETLADGHYKIDGDIQRELWFANDGYLQKAAFKRKGFKIEFVRN